MKRKILWPIVLFIFSAILRVAYKFYYHFIASSQGEASDTHNYLLMAKAFLAGNFRPDLYSSYLDRPLFPLLWSGVMTIAGDNLWVMSIINCLFSATAVVLVYYLAKTIFNRKIYGVVAGLFLAISPIQLFWSHFVLTEPLFLMLFAAYFLLFFQAVQKPKLRLWLSCGIIGALALLTRPIMMFLPIFLVSSVIFPFRHSRKVIFPVVLFSGIFIVIAFLGSLFAVNSNLAKAFEMKYYVTDKLYGGWDTTKEIREYIEIESGGDKRWILQKVEPEARNYSVAGIKLRAQRSLKTIFVYLSPKFYGFANGLWFKGAFVIYSASLFLTIVGLFFIPRYPLVYFTALACLVLTLVHSLVLIPIYARGRVHYEVLQAILLAPPVVWLYDKIFHH